MDYSDVCRLSVNEQGAFVIKNADGTTIPYQTDFSISSDVNDQITLLNGEQGALMHATFTVQVFLPYDKFK